MASRSGENSKHSLAQWRSSIHSSSTPASKVAAKPTVTRALNWKSPSGGTPISVSALSSDSALSWSPPPGSTKMSLCGAALAVTVASSIDHASSDDGVRANGSPGTAVMRLP